MNIQDYQIATRRTQASLPQKFDDEMHMILGIVTEAGELADAYKKHFAYSKPLDDVNIQEEIGDLMWYIIRLCDIRGYNLEKILGNNITKLYIRYPDKFASDKALVRQLEEERKALEK